MGLFLMKPFSLSLETLEFSWFHLAIFCMTKTDLSFLFCFKVMAAAVRLPAPGGHEDPCPALSSVHLLGYRRHAEVLRPQRHWHL